MFERIKNIDNRRFVICFTMFIIGVCAFSSNSSTSALFYITVIIYCGFSFLKIAQNKFIFKFNGAINGYLFFLLVLFCSFLWQRTEVYYSTRLITVAQIVLVCSLTAQWINCKNDVYLAIECLVWSNVVNCIYRLLAGGIQEVSSSKVVGTTAYIVGENELAVTLVIVFAFALFLYKEDQKKIYLLCAGFFFIVGLMTASRKAVLGFLIVVVIQFALKDKRIFKNFLLVFAILALFWIVLSHVEIFSYAYKRLQQLLDFTSGADTTVDASSQTRQLMRAVGWESFAQHPFLGYGVGYSYTFLQFGTYLHNNFIEVGVSLGIVGLLAFYCAHVQILYKAIRCKKNQNVKLVALSIIVSIFFMDYGAVTYFNKFIFIAISIVYLLMLYCSTKG